MKIVYSQLDIPEDEERSRKRPKYTNHYIPKAEMQESNKEPRLIRTYCKHYYEIMFSYLGGKMTKNKNKKNVNINFKLVSTV